MTLLLSLYLYKGAIKSPISQFTPYSCFHSIYYAILSAKSHLAHHLN